MRRRHRPRLLTRAAPRRHRPYALRRVRRRSRCAPPPSAAAVALKVGLGYIPSVQFAPFYLRRAGRLLRATPASR